MTAQGNALGKKKRPSQALKGRIKYAPSGLEILIDP